VDEGIIWFESPTVSRRHARILVAGAAATLEDLGSKNGTFLGGRRLDSPSPVSDGDEIRLGRVRMTFRVLPPVSTRTGS
jgi:pSer/pThr/pTyr-binding forkhead associated (FHA) protein